MHFSKFKTKLIFSLGIYALVWRYKAAKWLRDDFGAPLSPGGEVGGQFVPIYNIFVWWRFLVTIKKTELKAGVAKVVSPARAFWWSSLWFGAGPYLNRHLNALAETKSGKMPR
jgi:hypothetical protein